jgi:hypothetical protein
VTAGPARFEFPLRLQVMDWKLPDPAGLTTVMALEPSPYGVASQYQTPLWSDAHFRLLEESFKRLAEIGNDMAVVPVLLDSEFGNGPDSMIRWKRAGGKSEIDFAIAERFLDLVKKHLGPRCVCFVVCHSPQSLPGGQQKADQPQVAEAGADGKLSALAVPAPGTPEAQEFWRPLVEGLAKRTADRGMARALHWGYVGDTTTGTVNATIKDFAKLAPAVGWARAAHGWDRAELPFSFATTVRQCQPPILRGGKGVASSAGWKQPGVRLVFTRVENGAAVVYGFSGPIRYRLAPEAAIWSGCHGIGRWGADYWAKTYATRFNVTPTVLSVLWPGPNGAEGSARFECLREGLQETEARIALERKLQDKAYAASPAGKAAQEMLDDRIRAGLVQVLQAQDNTPQPRIEECFRGWQEASWALYAAAAATAGGRAPGADDERSFFAP